MCDQPDVYDTAYQAWYAANDNYRYILELEKRINTLQGIIEHLCRTTGIPVPEFDNENENSQDL